MRTKTKYTKITAIFIVLTMLMSISTGIMASEHTDTRESFTTYNLVTGETHQNSSRIQETSDIDGPTQGIDPNELEWKLIPQEDILADDYPAIEPYGFTNSWQKVSNTASSPYWTIASLVVTYTNGSKSWCTGFVVGASGKSRIVTAAHNLITAESSTRYASTVTAYFGRNGSYYKHSVTASSYTVSSWWNSASPTDRMSYADYDYAAIAVDDGVKNIVGNFGLTADANTATNYTLCGYPGYPGYSYPGYSFNGTTMYTSSGNASEIYTNYISHNNYSWNGMSGSPLYRSDKYVVAIQTRGSSNASTLSATATRTTQSVIDLVAIYS